MTSFAQAQSSFLDDAIFTGDRVGDAAMQRCERFDKRRFQPIPILRGKAEDTGRRRHGPGGGRGDEFRGFPRCEIAILREAGEIEAARRVAHKIREGGWRVGILHRREISETLRLGAAARGREDVDDSSTAERSLRGLIADDQAIAIERADGVVEHELNQGRFAGRDAGALQYRDAPRDIRCAEVDMDRSPVGQRAVFAFKNAKACVEAQDWIGDVARDDPIAAFDALRLQLRPGQIDGAALPCPAGWGGGVLRVNGARAERQSRLQDFHLFARRYASRHGGSGNDQPSTGDSE